MGGNILPDKFRDGALLVTIFFFSSIALRPNATIFPLIVALSGVLFYAPFAMRSRVSTALLWVVLAAGSGISKIHASADALSTIGLSLSVLVVGSLLSAGVVVGASWLHTRLSTRLDTPSTQLLVFPALWATAWYIIASISPVGYLLTWSVANNADGYNWLVPILGPPSKDWLVAAWSVLCSNLVGSWYLGSQPEADEDLLTMDSTIDTHEAAKSTAAKRKELVLLVTLSALILPSLFIDPFPLPIAELKKLTPLSVACILPPFDRYKHHVLTLEDFVDESKKFRHLARVILWPEGAVKFHNRTHREESFKSIREQLPGTYIGVAFEETGPDPTDLQGHKSISQNGLALLSQYSENPLFVYYKRHLVPGVESFSLTHSTNPAPYVDIEIPNPKGITRPDWAPAPNHTRPLPVSASICLDFAHPRLFADLPGRPALILGPARTWDRTIGNTMWLQAKQRAEEIGSTLLWCDGGEGAVSGVAGKGISDIQVGQGSFARTVAFEYPFESGSKTVFGRIGYGSLVLFWLLAFGPGALVTYGPRGKLRFVKNTFDKLVNRRRSGERELLIHHD